MFYRWMFLICAEGDPASEIEEALFLSRRDTAASNSATMFGTL